MNVGSPGQQPHQERGWGRGLERLGAQDLGAAPEDEPAGYDHDDPSVFGFLELVELGEQAQEGLGIAARVQDDRFAAGPAGHFASIRLEPVGDAKAGILEGFTVDLTFVAGRTDEEDLTS